MQGHPIIHIEIPASDAGAASKFYQDIFGWNIVVDKTYNYYVFSAEGGPGGGFIKVPEQGKVGEVVLYLNTDDIDASLKKVVQAGGKVLLEKMEVMGVGWIANFTDPTGNRMGLFTPNRTPR